MTIPDYDAANANCSPPILVPPSKCCSHGFLQPIDARRALPCWDEPLLKATFSVTLVSRKGTVNLSNMSARSKAAIADTFTKTLFEGVKDGSWHATSFETTPPVRIERIRVPDQLTMEQMSTYLLAFANGEFVHLESSYQSPLSGKVRPLRIYSMTLYPVCSLSC